MVGFLEAAPNMHWSNFTKEDLGKVVRSQSNSLEAYTDGKGVCQDLLGVPDHKPLQL